MDTRDGRICDYDEVLQMSATDQYYMRPMDHYPT